MTAATFHLVLKQTKRHPYLSASIHQRRPSVGPGEVSMQLDVDVPDALFKRPTLRASVKVPNGAAPPVIDSLVQDNIAEVLSKQLGIAVHVYCDEEP